jgi:hypothetical protein
MLNEWSDRASPRRPGCLRLWVATAIGLAATAAALTLVDWLDGLF